MAWLSGWTKRVKLTTDNTDIDSVLSDFPVTIFLGTTVGRNSEDISFVFDEVGTAFRKIAVTESDGTTECYVEVERWGSTVEEAVLHFKGPTLQAGTDTDFYLYYDSSHADNNDYVGALAGGTAQSVWNSNYAMVQHMEDFTTGTVQDSTSNNNDGSKKGGNEPQESSAKVGQGQHFDGVDDYINFGSAPSLDMGTMTVEWWANGTHHDVNNYILSKGLFNANQSFNFRYEVARFRAYYGTGAGNETIIFAAGTLINAWRHYAIKIDNSTIWMKKDGVDIGSSATTGFDSGTTELYVCVYSGGSPGGVFNIQGLVDEIRISNTLRSNAWIKASYETQRDNLLDWGAEETSAPSTPHVTFDNQSAGVSATAGVSFTA